MGDVVRLHPKARGVEAYLIALMNLTARYEEDPAEVSVAIVAAGANLLAETVGGDTASAVLERAARGVRALATAGLVPPGGPRPAA